MLPVLFEIPLPRWSLPLMPTFVILAMLALGVAVLGYRSGARDLALLGGLGALGSLVASIVLRGRSAELGPVPFFSYGTLVCLALVLGWFVALRYAERDGLGRDLCGACYLATAAGGFVGARLLYLATNPGEFASVGDVLSLRRGGLVAYGAFAGGFAASFLYLRHHKTSWLAWADTAAPSLAGGLAIGRLGCYLFGCDYGKPLGESAPRWLERLGTFPRWPETLLAGAGSPAWVDHVQFRNHPLDSEWSLPVHPTQLYESFFGALLLLAAVLVRRRQRFRGQVFLVVAAGYGLGRYLLELLRDDPERGFFGPSGAASLIWVAPLVVIGAAFGWTAIRTLGGWQRRVPAVALAMTPAALLFAWLARVSGGAAAQLSTSQWLGALSATAAAVTWALVAAQGVSEPRSN